MKVAAVSVAAALVLSADMTGSAIAGPVTQAQRTPQAAAERTAQIERVKVDLGTAKQQVHRAKEQARKGAQAASEAALAATDARAQTGK